MEKRQHSVSKLLRMTPEEAKLLEEKAKAAGMTESQYLRLMISQKPNDYPEVRQLLRDLINEVSMISSWRDTDISQVKAIRPHSVMTAITRFFVLWRK